MIQRQIWRQRNLKKPLDEKTIEEIKQSVMYEGLLACFASMDRNGFYEEQAVLKNIFNWSEFVGERY